MVESDESAADSTTNRRGFLRSTSSVAMGAGLLSGYGAFGVIAARFLYPAGDAPTAWQYVIDLASVPLDGTVPYRTPAGTEVTVVRRGETGTAEDFIALSSVCPHLGCLVHWEGHRERFFCPCHNGTFDVLGQGTGGPPGDAGLSLPRYPVKVTDGLLFLEVPVHVLPPATGTRAAGRGA